MFYCFSKLKIAGHGKCQMSKNIIKLGKIGLPLMNKTSKLTPQKPCPIPKTNIITKVACNLQPHVW